jgi:uncharacterized protein YgiM (DUF1202 family)
MVGNHSENLVVSGGSGDAEGIAQLLGKSNVDSVAAKHVAIVLPPAKFFKATTTLQVRDAPREGSGIITTIEEGAILRVEEETKNDWFRLRLRGRSDVWVVSKPSFTAAIADAPALGGAQFFKALASLQCRNKPDGGADAVISVEKNEILKVQEQRPDGWFRLSLRGREDLWVLSKNARSGKVMVEAMTDVEAALATFEKQETAVESLLSPDEAAKKREI